MVVTVKVNGMGRYRDKIEMFCETNWTNERTNGKSIQYAQSGRAVKNQPLEVERELRKVYSFKVDYLSKLR